MAFDFGSDILVDAMRAADPGRVAEARLRLSEAASVRQTPRTSRPAFPEIRAEIPRPGKAGDEQSEVLKKFEAVVLTTFVQSMMPKEAAAVFGEGLAGDMWKAQLAEQLAGQLAQRGGIGIASRLLKDYQQNGESVEAVTGLRDPAAAVEQSRGADGVARFLDSLELRTLGHADGRYGDRVVRARQDSNT